MKRNDYDHKTKRIAFVINSLDGGGAERVLCNLLEQLEPSLHNKSVFLILLDRTTERYKTPRYVHKIVLDSNGHWLSSVLLLQEALRRLRPDTVLSFLTRANCANILTALRLQYTCLISERVNTSSHFGTGLRQILGKILVKFLYRHADTVLVVSKGVGLELQQNFSVSTKKLRVIYNPCNIQRLTRLAAEPALFTIDGSYIISIGRLVPNKNFSLLIRAFDQAQLNDKLVILGEGPEHGKLTQLIRSLGLEQRVVLAGFRANPYPLIRHARFAVFCSRAEGFPNAMTEAMALSVPVIATDCPSGPAEILHDVVRVNPIHTFKAEFGLLVPMDDQNALIQALRLMNDDTLRSHYRRKSQDRIKAFSVDTCIAQYCSALGAPMQ